MSGENKEQPKKPATTPPKPAAAKPPVPAKPPAPAAAAPPQKKEPEPPAFEKGIADQIKNKFGESVKFVFIRPRRIKLTVEPKQIVEVATFLRDTLGLDHAESAGGTDYPKDNQIEMTYHLGSYVREDLASHVLFLSTRTARDDPRLPTLINVFKSVEYHEREAFEMLGIYFEGHPRNERFLLPEDWADIPPLRRDFRIKGR
jgi:NADH:ubiquinone oxidoreductase subunit C